MLLRVSGGWKFASDIKMYLCPMICWRYDKQAVDLNQSAKSESPSLPALNLLILLSCLVIFSAVCSNGCGNKLNVTHFACKLAASQVQHEGLHTQLLIHVTAYSRLLINGRTVLVPKKAPHLEHTSTYQSLFYSESSLEWIQRGPAYLKISLKRPSAYQGSLDL